MIRIEFSEQDLKKIQELRYKHSHPRVRRRMEVLWLKSQGLAHGEICRLAGISSNTLRQYLGIFQSGGIKKLTEFNFYAPTSELEPHRYRLEVYFREHPPATINEAAAKIQDLTGIKRSPSVVGRFLNLLGMAPRRVGTMPAQADPEKQEYFRINELEPRIEEARQGAFLGILWSFSRLFVKTSAGRKRFNVLGALNAITHELVLVTNDTYITADSVCDLLRRIAMLNLGVPITLVMDNARYQKCRIVTALALQLKIELLYLPAYSPNLNLIERLWKFVKKKVLYSKYYANFAEFRTAITDCLKQSHTKHKMELDSLLTLNFQAFKKCELVPI